jgi:hypothetical protein
VTPSHEPAKPTGPAAGKANSNAIANTKTNTAAEPLGAGKGKQTQKPLPTPPKPGFRHEKKKTEKAPLASLIRGVTNRSKAPPDES